MRAIFIICFVLSELIYSQNFKLTPNNFINISDQSKDYIVIDYPGKTKYDLFVAAKKAVNSINSKSKYVSSDHYSEISDEQITFNVNSNKSKMLILNFSGSNLYHVYLKYELNFKDEKIMIKPTFLYLTNNEYNQEFLADLWKRNESKLNKSIEFINSENALFIDEFYQNLNHLINNDW